MAAEVVLPLAEHHVVAVVAQVRPGDLLVAELTLPRIQQDPTHRVGPAVANDELGNDVTSQDCRRGTAIRARHANTSHWRVTPQVVRGQRCSPVRSARLPATSTDPTAAR